ncbi:MAG: glycerophosphoryl diester phosphodiesterase [Micavibrio aeruginosavorus]|uniref:Glycerophosphoryl diester phosphodiesterase n=1 Tax=Micavibrio aeruginosavorus TaxID=349221 RepID=A0A2W5PY27_9BACT|nr:MAG: glycerophosphoryl diester phosphodiesterase [Micavibrio aeruginosavorus]
MTKLNLPKVIGHRGAKAYAPENTIESIQTAASLGVAWVELDVKLTRDGVPVIFHDEELDRTTNGTGLMAHMTYEDIRDLDAGSWFGDSFAACRIPTLEQAVDVILKHDLGLNLEIKPCPGREKETAEVALDYLSRFWDDPSKLLISSFQHVSLEAALDLAPDYARGLLIGGEEMPENWKEMAEYLDASTINLGSRLVNRQVADEVMDLELPLLVYTVNDPMQARSLQKLGVDAFFSDNPDVILENLAGGLN